MSWWKSLLAKWFGGARPVPTGAPRASFDVDLNKLTHGPVSKLTALPKGVSLVDGERIVCRRDAKDAILPDGCRLDFKLEGDERLRLAEVYVGQMRRLEPGESVGSVRLEAVTERGASFSNSVADEKPTIYTGLFILDDFQGRPKAIVVDPQIYNNPIPDEPPYD